MNILTQQMVDKINAQIGNELHNANQYLAIAAYFNDLALFNIGKEYQKQAEDERSHAQKFIDYLVDLRGKLNIPLVTQPINEFSSALDAVRAALSLELKTTQEIYDLVDLAKSQNDHISFNFLQWYINEQQEEIATANDRLSIISAVGADLVKADIYFAEKA